MARTELTKLLPALIPLALFTVALVGYGAVKVMGRWLPTSLTRAPARLLTGTAPDWYLPAVAVAATAGLLALATARAHEPAP